MARTPEEFEKIALWLGWEPYLPFNRAAVWVRPNREITDYIERKTSLTPAEAVEALGRLVEKGYSYTLGGGNTEGHSVSIARPIPDGYEEIVSDTMWHPTFTLAVETAILAMLEKEGER